MNGFKRVKSSWITKLIVVAIAVYAVISLLSLQAQITDAQAQQEELSVQVASMEQKNEKLREEIDAYDESESAEQMARDKLGLVSQGELVFYDISN